MEITSELIKEAYIDLSVKARVIKENDAYVTGKNPTIKKEPGKAKPDNRIPVPFAKMSIMTIVGYAGRPGDITTNYVKAEAKDLESTEYEQKIKEYSEYNEEKTETAELLTTSLAQGVAYELWWISESNGEQIPEYKIIPPSESCPIYSDDIKPKMEAFIRFWKDKKDIVADVYYVGKSERWRKKESEEKFSRDEEGDTKYPYKEVPVIQFNVNMTGSPIYEAEKPLIDSYDSAISKSQNEVDRFNAEILQLPAKLDAKGKAALASGEQSIFDDLSQFEKWPEYLHKSLSGVNEFYKNQTTNLERLYHKSVGIPDISDESFAGNQSGVAIAYKLIPLEFLVTQVEGYFIKGLIARKDMYDDFINMFHPKINTEEYIAEVNWKRNIPIDDKAKIEAAAILSAIVSPETVLEYLPNTIVQDKEREMALLVSPEPIDESTTDPSV